MSPEEQATFPLAQDGLDFWNLVKKYVSDYLQIFYPSDESVVEDTELQDYWTHYKYCQTGLDQVISTVLSLFILTKGLLRVYQPTCPSKI